MFTTLIRPSVARSLALIPQYAEAALSASMPNTVMPRWAVLVDTSVKARQEQQECTDRNCPAGHRYGVSHLHLDVL